MESIVNCNYKLLDCGKFEKLEQCGEVVIRRPAPHATWRRKLDTDIWKYYHFHYVAEFRRNLDILENT